MSLFLFVYLSFCRISQPFLRCGNACAVTLFCCWTSRRIFSCVLRWRCRRCTCSRTGRTDRLSWVFVLHMIWDAHDVVQTSVSASVTTRKEKLKQFNPPLSKACWACIDALKQLSLQHKGTHSEKGHKVFTLQQKLKKGYQQARSVHQELPRYASFSYTNLCLAVTTLPPRAKGTPCSDMTAGLLVASPNYQAPCIPLTTSLSLAVTPPSRAPSPLRVRTQTLLLLHRRHCCQKSPVQLSSDLSCSACALMLWNPPQINFPRVSSKMALVMTKTSAGE